MVRLSPPPHNGVPVLLRTNPVPAAADAGPAAAPFTLADLCLCLDARFRLGGALAQAGFGVVAGQQPQVVAELLQQAAVGLGQRFHVRAPHGGPPSCCKRSQRSRHVFASSSTTAPPASSSIPVLTSTHR